MKTRLPPNKAVRNPARLAGMSNRLAFCPIAFNRVLVPFDFSAESKHALRYALALARKVGASLTLLHVVEPLICEADYGYGCVIKRSPNQCVLQHKQTGLNSVAGRVASRGSRPLAIVRSGDAETEIVRAAIDFAANLIVIGSHGQSAFPISVGSTAEKVVRNAPCPVLVVRRRQPQPARSPKRGAL